MVLASCLILGILNSFGWDEPDVLAEVNGYAISRQRVKRFLAKKLGNQKLDSRAQRVAQYEATQQLVNRHLVFNEITASGTRIGNGQVALEVSKLEDRLAEIDQTLSQYLATAGISRDELEYEFRWRLAWRKYLENQLTAKRLDSYYKKFKRKFDGTEMHVAHILLDNKVAHVLDNAAKLKYEIETGAVNWSEAAKQHSIATTSASRGGEIGWINYDGPMVPEFCVAAMKLEKGNISEPVKTSFGVHLIKCLDIKPGKIGPGDARQKVRKDAMNYLFDSLAKKARKSADIRLLIEVE